MSSVSYTNRMFESCSSLTYLDFSKLLSPNIVDMDNMFKNCHKLTSLDLSGINSNPKYMSNLFQNCYDLQSLNIANLKTDNVEYPEYIFENCNSLTSLDLSNFTFSNARSLESAFQNCYSLTSINLKNFHTIYLDTTANMFKNCGKLKSLDLSHLITDEVFDMSYMFYNCSSLETLLVKFNTLNIMYMQYMFASCISLSSLNIGTFSTESAIDLSDMFDKDEGLILYLNFTACANLKEILPEYVTPININSNHFNKALLIENNNLLSEVSNLKKTISDLNNRISQLNNINDGLKRDVDNYKNSINKLNIQNANLMNQLKKIGENNKLKSFGNKKDEIISLMKKNEIKDNQINQIKSDLPFNLKDGETLLPIIFLIGDQKVHYSLICKDSEKFSEVEGRLYEIFPDYSEVENYFMCNGIKINRFKTLKENRIKYSDIIMMNSVSNRILTSFKEVHDHDQCST